MKEVKVDFYCRECEASYVSEERLYECPHCNSKDVCNSDFIQCDCGRRVYIPNITNICECGKYYNGFGQELAPPEEWDEDERYSCFGPDCSEDC